MRLIDTPAALDVFYKYAAFRSVVGSKGTAVLLQEKPRAQAHVCERRHIVINYAWLEFVLTCGSSSDPAPSPAFLTALIMT